MVQAADGPSSVLERCAKPVEMPSREAQLCGVGVEANARLKVCAKVERMIVRDVNPRVDMTHNTLRPEIVARLCMLASALRCGRRQHLKPIPAHKLAGGKTLLFPQPQTTSQPDTVALGSSSYAVCA